MRMSSGERERLKTKAFKMEVREVKCWSRSDISTYNCSEKHYRHVYCPCSDCNGWATDRSTELRHWCHTNILFDHESDETQLVVVEPGTNKFLRLGKIEHNDFPCLEASCLFISTSQLSLWLYLFNGVPEISHVLGKDPISSPKLGET